MQSITLSCTSVYTTTKTLKTPIIHQNRAFCSLSPKRHQLGSLSYNPLSVNVMNTKGRGFGAVCYSGSLIGPLSSVNLQWIATVSTGVLMLVKDAAFPKSFLVPLFVLTAPANLVTWMKGEYGVWAAFLALLVRLFYYIPGELELPFITLMMVIVAPYEVLRLRGTKEGVILSLVVAAYLAFVHFSKQESLKRSFGPGSILATIATICVVLVPCLLLI